MEDIKVKDVSKFDRHGRTLLDRVNLEIEGGTTLCLIGPHNSGKTSLLLSISGNTKIDKGEIYFGEELINSPLRNLHRSGTKRIGDILTPHPYEKARDKNVRPIQHPDRSSFPTNTSGLNWVDKIACLVPFSRDKFFLNQVISERLELLAQRNIFLLDDPLTGMDSLTRSKTKEALKALLKELKVTTILITYFTKEAFYLGNKVAIMRTGKIEQAGSREIIEHPANDFVRDYLKA